MKERIEVLNAVKNVGLQTGIGVRYLLRMKGVLILLACCGITRISATFEFFSNGAQLILTNVTDMEFTSNLTRARLERVIDISVVSSNISLTELLRSLVEMSDQLDISSIEIIDGHLDTLKEDEFLPLEKISYITLSQCRIRTLEEGSFSNLTELHHLDLSNNYITSLTYGTFTRLPKLNELYLQDNLISTIQDATFADVPLLNLLYLYNNSLMSVPYRALANTTVTYLYLSNNQITDVTSEIVLLKHLKLLELSRNKIRTVSEQITQLQSLTKLYLFDNELTTLPESIQPLLNNFIDVSENPWKCDCSLVWLIHWAQRSNNTGVPYQLDCATPYNITMRSLDTRVLDCEEVEKVEEEEERSVSPIVISILITIPAIIGFSIVVAVWLVRTRTRFFGKSKQLQMVASGIYYRPRVADRRSPLVLSRNNNEPIADDIRALDQDAGFTSVKEYGKIRLGNLIGRGAFGDVYEAVASEKNNTWKKVAVKKLRDHGAIKDQRSIIKEFHNLREIGQHPNIVTVIGYGIINGSVIMVMELAEHGDLLTYLHNLEKREHRSINSLDHSEERFYLQTYHPQLFVFMWHVAKGMEYLSRLKVVHRDLAARNILISEGPVAKISDFGLSRDIYESGYYFQTSCGRLPYKWLSPETLSAGKSTLNSDVWSYGVLLWEITTLGGSPYPGIPPNMLLEMLNVGYRMHRPPLCPEQIYDVMLKCWKLVPDERSTFDVIVDILDKFIQVGSDKEYVDMGTNEYTPMIPTNLNGSTWTLKPSTTEHDRTMIPRTNGNTRTIEPSEPV